VAVIRSSEGPVPSRIALFGVPLLDLVLVVAIAVLTSWANLTWAAQNTAPPESDANTHVFFSLAFHDSLGDAPGPLLPRTLIRFLNYREHYPPLAYQVGEAGWIALGRSLQAPVLGVAPFLLVLAFSMYGLGRLLAGRIAGLLAAVMCCTAPVVLDHSRTLFLDLPLTALVAFGTWTLLASRSFQDLRHSRAWGVALGLGMLTKWTFLVFVTVPLIVALATAFRARRPGNSETALGMLAVALLLTLIAFLCFPLDPEGLVAVWGLTLLGAVLLIARLRRDPGSESALVNGAESLILGVALAAPYYAASQDLVLDKITYQAGVQVEVLRVLGMNLREQALWMFLSAPWWFLGPVLGLVRQPTRSRTLQLLGSVALSTAFAALIPYDARYLMPNLPLLVALSTNAVRGAPRFGAAALILAVGLGTLQATCHLTKGLEEWPTLHDRRSAGMLQQPWLPPLPLPPRTEPYPFDALLDRLVWKDAGRRAVVCVAASPTETASIQARALRLFARLQGREIRLWEMDHDLLSPPQEEVPNYLLIYRHPDHPGDGRIRQDMHGPVTRQGLLHRAIEMKAFPKGLQSVAVFRFGEATAVELLSPDPSTRSTSLPEEEGGLPAGAGRPDRTARGRRGRAAGVGLHRAGPVV